MATARITEDGQRLCALCDRTHRALGYCDAHRKRYLKYGDPEKGGPIGHQGGRRPFVGVIEDVEWLLGTDSPASIARRVGYKDVSDLIGRLANKAGRPDLADRLRSVD